MPTPSKYTPTLAGVQNSLIKNQPSLSPGEHASMVSAINRLCKVNSLSPADVVADPAVLRDLIARTPWKLAGLKKESWANIRSRLKKALSISGIKVDRQRRNFKLSDEWGALLAPLNRRDHDELHRFAGWCSVHGHPPEEVSAAVHARFMADLETQSLQRNPRERAHVARRVWNRAIAVPGSPYTPLPGPEPSADLAMRWSDFPETLQAQIAALAATATTATKAASLFGKDKDRPIKPVTLKNYDTRLRVLATALVADGLQPEELASLASLVKPAMVRRGLIARLGERDPDDSKVRQDLSTIATAALWAARKIGLRKADIDQLRRDACEVRFTPNGMCETNKRRLRPLLDDPATLRLLLGLPLRVATDLRSVVKPTARDAQRVQMACLLEILIHMPLRIRNAAELDLARTIQAPLAGKIGDWRVSIPGDEVKNGVAVDGVLKGESGSLLDLYVSRFRPILSGGAPTTRLFVGQSGTPKGESALSKQLGKFVLREIGVSIHAHLIRHLAAHLYLRANPGDYETARRLIGHKRTQTLITHYAGFAAEYAFEQYDAIIAQHRHIPSPESLVGLDRL